MPFDSNKPANGSPLSSAVMREQFNDLKALIDAQTAQITAVQQQVTQVQADLVAQLSDTARDPWGQLPNLDPNYQPSDPPVAADILWVVARLIEMNNALARD